MGTRNETTMSSRWYPIYQRGNPQLRIFLPNFWMKIIKPRDNQPSNVVTFKISMQMSKLDVKNYLEKIYKVNTVDVTTHIQMGKMKRAKVGSYIVKEDDEKVAFVTLPKTEKFTFPVLFPEEKEEKEEQDIKQLATLKKEYDGIVKKHKNRPGVPSWFGI